MSSHGHKDVLRFAGRFELQPTERRLLVDGEPASVGSRAFDLLLELAARPGELRTKNDLLEAVWPGVVVEEGNIATQISALRKILGGDVIATIPGRGYRFTARIDSNASAGPAPSLSTTPAEVPAAALPSPAARLQTHLPPRLPQLVGRSEDLAALNELVARHHIVSIIGAGGMGKTSVALHVTAGRQGSYQHGVCWVELANISDAQALPSAIAAAIGVNIDDGDPFAGLPRALTPLTMLITLDNVEQVVDGVARVVQAVLDKAPGVRFLITSQAPLKLAGERTYRLGALPVPQGPLPAQEALTFGAVALFAEYAHAADAHFELTDANAPAVIELCRQLDGMALAIELAAARAPMLGVQRLASSMGDRLKVLTHSRNRTAPARQQTLRAALEWSHGFLDASEQAVFRRLAVFAGSASLTMIQQVVADPPGEGELDEWAVLDALALLVERSLVVALTTDDTAEPRYRLLGSPRAFARERLHAAGEEGALHRRYVLAMAAACDAAWHAVFSAEVGWNEWLGRFQLDADNAREALSLAIADGNRIAALRIGATLLHASYDVSASPQLELAEQCSSQIDDDVPPSLRIRVGIRIALTLAGIRPEWALESARQAWGLARRTALPEGDRFAAYLAACSVALAVGPGSANRDEQQDALAQARALEDPVWPAQRRIWRARAEFLAAQADAPRAQQLGIEALALEFAAGGSGHYTRGVLIATEFAAGNAEAAIRTGEALLADLQGSRKERARAFARVNLAAAWLTRGNPARVRELAQAGWPQSELFGLHLWWADHLTALAALEARPAAAARLAGYADAAYARREQTRGRTEEAAHERACALARAALGDDEFERLRAEGRLLGAEQIEAIAFALED